MSRRTLTPAAMAKQARLALLHALDPVAWTLAHGFRPDEWQARLLRSSAKQIAVACGRRVGKTTTVSWIASHAATYQPRSLTLICSPGQRQASEMLKQVRSNLGATGAKFTSDAVTALELPNGGRVLSLPANPDLLRGYSPSLICMDEAAYCEDELYLALRPMLAATQARCRLILLSTFNLRSGFFWSATNDPDFEVYKVSAYDCPRIDQSFLDAELAKHGDTFFRREYLAEPVDSEFCFFGTDLIQAAFDCSEPGLRVRLFT